MKDANNLLDVCLCSVGITYGLENIENLLGVIILTINLVQIVIKCIVKLNKLYNEEVSPKEVISALGSAEDKVEEMLDQITIEEVEKSERSNKP